MAAPEFYASSPTVILPSQQPTEYFGPHYSPFNGTSHPVNPSMIADGSKESTSASSLAGRKRSRGDITAPDDEDDSVAPPSDLDMDTTSGAKNESTQNVTSGRRQSHAQRPSFSSRKSQRVDSSATGQNHLAQLVLPPSMREATVEPLIDEATRVLGISWSRMDSTETLLINQAAYQKWIQNYYPGLKDVSIWFENSAIPGYLVQTVNVYTGQQEWYIFSHDLMEARLVTNEASQLVPRLQLLPALHLAAPGGQIYAQTDPVSVAMREAGEVQAEQGETMLLRGRIQDHVYPPGKALADHAPSGMCAAHQMELD